VRNPPGGYVTRPEPARVGGWIADVVTEPCSPATYCADRMTFMPPGVWATDAPTTNFALRQMIHERLASAWALP
jgi:hypothetical protein